MGAGAIVVTSVAQIGEGFKFALIGANGKLIQAARSAFSC